VGAGVFIGQVSVAILGMGGGFRTAHPVAACVCPACGVAWVCWPSVGLPHTAQAAGLAGRRGGGLQSGCLRLGLGKTQPSPGRVLAARSGRPSFLDRWLFGLGRVAGPNKPVKRDAPPLGGFEVMFFIKVWGFA